MQIRGLNFYSLSNSRQKIAFGDNKIQEWKPFPEPKNKSGQPEADKTEFGTKTEPKPVITKETQAQINAINEAVEKGIDKINDILGRNTATRVEELYTTGNNIQAELKKKIGSLVDDGRRQLSSETSSRIMELRNETSSRVNEIRNCR